MDGMRHHPLWDPHIDEAIYHVAYLFCIKNQTDVYQFSDYNVWTCIGYKAAKERDTDRDSRGLRLPQTMPVHGWDGFFILVPSGKHAGLYSPFYPASSQCGILKDAQHLTTFPDQRSGCGLVFLPPASLYVVGGNDNNRRKDMLLFDLDTCTWSSVPRPKGTYYGWWWVTPWGPDHLVTASRIRIEVYDRRTHVWKDLPEMTSSVVDIHGLFSITI